MVERSSMKQSIEHGAWRVACYTVLLLDAMWAAAPPPAGPTCTGEACSEGCARPRARRRSPWRPPRRRGVGPAHAAPLLPREARRDCGARASEPLQGTAEHAPFACVPAGEPPHDRRHVCMQAPRQARHVTSAMRSRNAHSGPARSTAAPRAKGGRAERGGPRLRGTRPARRGRPRSAGCEREKAGGESAAHMLHGTCTQTIPRKEPEDEPWHSPCS